MTSFMTLRGMGGPIWLQVRVDMGLESLAVSARVTQHFATLFSKTCNNGSYSNPWDSTYMRTASFGFPALTNSISASWNLPSSSKYMACFRCISGSLFFMAILPSSKAKSNALKKTGLDKQNCSA